MVGWYEPASFIACGSVCKFPGIEPQMMEIPTSLARSYVRQLSCSLPLVHFLLEVIIMEYFESISLLQRPIYLT